MLAGYGLGKQDVEVGRQLERRAEALDEGDGAGERPGNPQPPFSAGPAPQT